MPSVSLYVWPNAPSPFRHNIRRALLDPVQPSSLQVVVPPLSPSSQHSIQRLHRIVLFLNSSESIVVDIEKSRASSLSYRGSLRSCKLPCLVPTRATRLLYGSRTNQHLVRWLGQVALLVMYRLWARLPNSALVLCILLAKSITYFCHKGNKERATKSSGKNYTHPASSGNSGW